MKRIVKECIVIVVIVIAFLILNIIINHSRRNSFILVNDNTNYSYQIEDCICDGDAVIIKGWFLRIAHDSNGAINYESPLELSMLLVDAYNDDGTPLQKGIKAEMRVREDDVLTNYYSPDRKETVLSFEASFTLDQVDNDSTTYRIVFNTDKKSKEAIASSYYYYNGDVYSVNPLDIPKFDFVGSEIDEVIDRGQLLVARPNERVYVFQYKARLYYIVDKTNSFLNDNEAFLVHQFYTCQYDKLPKRRVDEGYTFDDKNGYFVSYEITDIVECGMYRVSVWPLPTEYAITSIILGEKEGNQWKWRDIIRPEYQIKENEVELK